MFWNQSCPRSDFHCLALWRVAGEQLSFCKTRGTHPVVKGASWKKPALKRKKKERGEKKEKNWYILWLWGEEKQLQVDLFSNVVSSTILLTYELPVGSKVKLPIETFLSNKL